jgi:xanthine dehydrogenase accessory factor
LLAVRDDGVVSGSVSGGCVEDDLIARIKAGEYDSLDHPSIVAYGVSKEEAARFGLPCGGTLRLVQEPVKDTAWIAAVLERTNAHQLVARTVKLSTGEVSLRDAARTDALHFDGITLTTLFGPRWRLLLIGAGQLSQAVAHMAKLLDFEVLVCDPREEYRGAWSVAGVTVKSDMPDDLVQSFKPDRRSCVIALTHDPKLDDLALLEALNTEAFYIGAIGSRRNNEARHQRMIEHFAQTPESLARLRGPIGIYIGSKTPAEIAVSIMAEVLAVKNHVPLPRDMDVAHAKNAQQTPHNAPDAATCFIPR